MHRSHVCCDRRRHLCAASGRGLWRSMKCSSQNQLCSPFLQLRGKESTLSFCGGRIDLIVCAKPIFFSLVALFSILFIFSSAHSGSYLPSLCPQLNSDGWLWCIVSCKTDLVHSSLRSDAHACIVCVCVCAEVEKTFRYQKLNSLHTSA